MLFEVKTFAGLQHTVRKNTVGRDVTEFKMQF